MIPRKDQSCLYNGVPITVIDVLHTFPTSYLVRSAEGRESIVDDTPSFSPAPLPDTMSEMERLQAENAQLRAEIERLKKEKIIGVDYWRTLYFAIKEKSGLTYDDF